MNPADRRYSYSTDDIAPIADAQHCELCGQPICGCDDEVSECAIHRAMERVYRLAEWCLWCGMSGKAMGSTIRVICAKMINPRASFEQIAAVVGMSRFGVRHAVERIKDNLPHVYRALWREGVR